MKMKESIFFKRLSRLKLLPITLSYIIVSAVFIAHIFLYKLIHLPAIASAEESGNFALFRELVFNFMDSINLRFLLLLYFLILFGGILIYVLFNVKKLLIELEDL